MPRLQINTSLPLSPKTDLKKLDHLLLQSHKGSLKNNE
jgi:hypothetical protein